MSSVPSLFVLIKLNTCAKAFSRDIFPMHVTFWSCGQYRINCTLLFFFQFSDKLVSEYLTTAKTGGPKMFHVLCKAIVHFHECVNKTLFDTHLSSNVANYCVAGYTSPFTKMDTRCRWVMTKHAVNFSVFYFFTSRWRLLLNNRLHLSCHPPT